MPRLSAWYIRAALLYLLAGFTFGALKLANKGQPFWPGAWGLLPPHVEFLLLGWTAQLALGVAFWILPRYPSGSHPAGPRGDERPARAAFWLLNLGILLVALQALSPLLMLVGRIAEISAGVLFLAHAWGRVRPLVV